MSRADDWNRISAMAGLDASGQIAPPPVGMTLDRSPSPYWHTRHYFDHAAGKFAASRMHACAPAREAGQPLHFLQQLPVWFPDETPHRFASLDDLVQAAVEGRA